MDSNDGERKAKRAIKNCHPRYSHWHAGDCSAACQATSYSNQTYCLCKINNSVWMTAQYREYINTQMFTSSASRLMKLAIAKPSMTSSSQDTDSLFLRRGGLCLPKPGRHSRLPGPRTLFVPHASRSEPEDMDMARSCARFTLLRRRSLSRWERDRRLCLNPVLRLGPSIIKPPFSTPVKAKALYISPSPVSGTEPQINTTTRALGGAPLKWR